MGFERSPVQLDGLHVLVRLQVQHGGDRRLPPESLDIIDGLGMRSDEESGQDLGVVHGFVGANSIRFARVLKDQ